MAGGLLCALAYMVPRGVGAWTVGARVLFVVGAVVGCFIVGTGSRLLVDALPGPLLRPIGIPAVLGLSAVTVVWAWRDGGTNG